MKKNPAELARLPKIRSWHLRDSDHARYTATLVSESRHAGKKCALVQSIAADADDKKEESCGYFTQVCGVDDYSGKRIRMTAWAKSELPEDSLVRIELCVIGEWGWYCKWNGTFDNLGNYPILGTTEWKEYALVVEVPENANSMSFGALLFGKGKVWLDEFKFENVDKNTPLTGRNSKPENLNFEEMV